MYMTDCIFKALDGYRIRSEHANHYATEAVFLIDVTT
jgi:hypothetical protein